MWPRRRGRARRRRRRQRQRRRRGRRGDELVDARVDGRAEGKDHGEGAKGGDGPETREVGEQREQHARAVRREDRLPAVPKWQERAAGHRFEEVLRHERDVDGADAQLEAEDG